MEFRFDEEQLGAAADRRPASAPTGSPSTRSAAREGRPVDRGALARSWPTLGVFGLLLAESDGGIGLGVVEGALVFEQLGSHLAPGPVLWTLLAAPLVDGAAAGERLVGGVEAADVVDGSARRRARRRARRAARRCAPTASSPAPRSRRWPRPSRSTRSIRSRRSAGVDGARRRRGGRRRRATRRGCGSLGTVLSAAHARSASPTRRPRRRARLRPRAPAVRRPDRLVPGDQAPAGRHVRPERRSPRAPPTLPPRCSHDPAAATPPGAAAAAKLLAGEAAIDNAGPRSRSSAAWASPGTCSPTTSSSGRGCSSTPSATPTIARRARHRARVERRARSERRRARRRASRSRPTTACCASRSTGPTRKNSLDAAGRPRASSRRSRRRRPTTRCAPSCSPRSGADFCSGADWVATQRAGGEQPAHRQHPAAHAAPGAPADRAARWRSSSRSSARCAGWAAGLGCQLALAADFTVAAETAASGSRSSSAASAPDSGATWLLPAPRRRGPGQGAAAARPAGHAAPRPPAWGMIHRAVPDDELDARRRGAGRRAGGRPPPSPSASPSTASTLRSTAARRGDGGRGDGARALVAHRATSARAWPPSRSGATPGSRAARGDAMEFETILYEVADRIATITFNRPDQLNALSPQMVARAARRPTPRAEADDDVWTIARHRQRAGVLRRRRRRRDPRRRPGHLRRAVPLDATRSGRRPQEATPPFRTMTKPVIAAVNGLCCGAGLDWVTTGDIAIASDRAEFFDPHVSIGLVSGREMVRLARVLPTNIAMRIALTGPARADERAARLRARPGLRGRRARPPARAGARDRRARQPQRAARGAGHAPRDPQGPRPAAARGRDPGRGVPRAGACAPTTPRRARAAFVEKRDPKWTVPMSERLRDDPLRDRRPTTSRRSR